MHSTASFPSFLNKFDVAWHAPQIGGAWIFYRDCPTHSGNLFGEVCCYFRQCIGVADLPRGVSPKTRKASDAEYAPDFCEWVAIAHP